MLYENTPSQEFPHIEYSGVRVVSLLQAQGSSIRALEATQETPGRTAMGALPRSATITPHVCLLVHNHTPSAWWFPLSLNDGSVWQSGRRQVDYYISIF